MIAWERHVDATRDDAASLYRRLSAPVTFADGNPAAYGFGLGRRTELGRQVSGHGGALRGWRSHRMYVPGERVSVVVMFNHLSDAHAAAVDLLAAVLDEDRLPPAPSGVPGWLGSYLEPETALAARLEAVAGGGIRLRYGHSAETLDLSEDGTAGNGVTRLLPAEDGLRMQRTAENHTSVLQPVGGVPALDVAGHYTCAEYGAELDVVDAGGSLYGAFAGHLGQGRMEKLEPVGGDVWTLPCPRALDHTPPGDWTLRFQRDGTGRIETATVGCWLARGLTYYVVR